MTSPWLPVEPLDGAQFAELRRRAIVDCCKWDPQVGDACAIARSPLVVSRTAWNEVVRIAESLAAETLAAERELVERPELHPPLGLPRAARRALRRAASIGAPAGAARLVRFDFHFTTEGWRISEANCDVPGGLNEASGLPLAIGAHYAWATSVGDPAGAYAKAIAARTGRGGTVALVHATAYSDDQQMMLFVARRLEAAGDGRTAEPTSRPAGGQGRSISSSGSFPPNGLVSCRPPPGGRCCLRARAHPSAIRRRRS
jgi:hypothetical protein